MAARMRGDGRVTVSERRSIGRPIGPEYSAGSFAGPATGRRVREGAERKRHQLFLLDRDHGPDLRSALPVQATEVVDGAVPQVTRVFDVEGDRRGAPELVADVLRRDGDLLAALGEAAG